MVGRIRQCLFRMPPTEPAPEKDSVFWLNSGRQSLQGDLISPRSLKLGEKNFLMPSPKPNNNGKAPEIFSNKKYIVA